MSLLSDCACLIVLSKLFAMSSTESNSFENSRWGTLWQLATILPDVVWRYTQAVPSVMMIWDTFAICELVASRASFSFFSRFSLDVSLKLECASKQCQRSFRKKISDSEYDFLRMALPIKFSIANG